jgi:hypothetical protein
MSSLRGLISFRGPNPGANARGHTMSPAARAVDCRCSGTDDAVVQTVATGAAAVQDGRRARFVLGRGGAYGNLLYSPEGFHLP